MDLLASVVADGQSRGEIRTGNAHALAHLYSVLINEHIFLNAEATAHTGTSLSQAEFHALVDDALQPSGQSGPHRVIRG
jgi:hypothetical protein